MFVMKIQGGCSHCRTLETFLPSNNLQQSFCEQLNYAFLIFTPFFPIVSSYINKAFPSFNSVTTFPLFPMCYHVHC